LREHARASAIGDEPRKSADKETVPVSQPPTPVQPEKRRLAEVVETPFLGRGGPTHQYFQDLIKREAEHNGYRGKIEKPVEGGYVDVVLEKEGQTAIACEISITTSPEQEIGNLEKCIRSGFGQIAFIALEQRTLDRVKKLAEAKCSKADFEKVLFATPEEFLVRLDNMAAQSSRNESTTLGYKVSTTHKSLTKEEIERRKKEIIRTINQKTMKKLKE
jgi:hypothetical protein